MSRIIKFRAWDTAGKYFKPLEDDGDYYFRDDGDGLVLFNKWGWAKDIVLLQFTGLTDKNGKEIYEADILLFWKGFNETYREYTGEVKWHQQAGSWYVPCGKFYQDIVGFAQSGDGEIVTLDNAEVIGNIYETPSLIKL